MAKLPTSLKGLRNRLSKYKYAHFTYIDNDGIERNKTYFTKDLDIELCTTFFRIYLYSINFSKKIEPITNITNIFLSNSTNENISKLTNRIELDINVHYVRFNGNYDKSSNVAVTYSQDDRFQQFRFDLEVWYQFYSTKDMLESIKQPNLKYKILSYKYEDTPIPKVINYDEIRQNEMEHLYLTSIFKLLKTINLKKKNRRYKILG